MLIARAPVRISFAGGGTDMPAYYEQYGGLVISTTINKYFYVMINNLQLGESQIISADYQSLFSVGEEGLSPNLIWDGDLGLPKAVLAHFGARPGENIFLACEVPPGTGLGSSSAAAVGLIAGLARQRNLGLSKMEIAEIACQIELGTLKMPIGKQDQYASALGGLNRLEFGPEGVKARPLKMSQAGRKALQERLLLFFTGLSHNSTTILKEQQSSVVKDNKVVLENLHRLKELAAQLGDCLEQEDLDDFGAILNEGWQRKKSLSSNIANSAINEMYELACRAGAEGGKITGAGGGGFLMLYCPPEKQPGVIKTLQERGIRKLNFQFEEYGVNILLDQGI
jgi:D-glycero-alpha-D-manno-heptose-7-phosphate kinase